MDITPADVLRIIFSHVTKKTDILSMRLVSKVWKRYTERFVHAIELSTASHDWQPIFTTETRQTEYKGYNQNLTEVLHRDMGMYRRYTPSVFKILPGLKSASNGSYLPLFVDNLAEIPLLANHVKPLDVFTIIRLNIHKYTDKERVYVHTVAKEFLRTCFSCIQHRHEYFVARCNIIYSTQCPLMECITFKYLQGTITISSIDATNGEFPQMRYFRDNDFIMQQLTSVAPLVTGLSTWFLRFDLIWTPQVLPHLTKIRVYLQTLDLPRLFMIFNAMPLVDTLIHTYHGVPPRYGYNVMCNLTDSLSKYIKEGKLQRCVKTQAVHLILPFYHWDIPSVLEQFPTVQSIGLFGDIRWCRPILQDIHTDIIEKLRLHGVKHLRIYSGKAIKDLPQYPGIQVEQYILSSV